MGVERKPFQGVLNIIQFNRHFYIAASLVLTALVLLLPFLPEPLRMYSIWGVVMAICTMTVSLIVSYKVYDRSDLYKLPWLSNLNGKSVLNINAGFDEVSEIVKNDYPDCKLTLFDFYDAKKHTEVSIKRARKAYPPPPETIQVTTDMLPAYDSTFDFVLAVLSAHEIRNENERIIFFKELNRVTKPNGQVVVTEHVRDVYNFMAYTLGFLHFHSKSTWSTTFARAGFIVQKELKTTPFITTFILEKHGDTF